MLVFIYTQKGEFMKFGIRRKLEAFILPIVAIALILVIGITYSSSKKSIEDKTEKLLNAEAASSANAIEAWANRNLGILDTAIDTMIYQNMDKEALLKYEERYLDTYTDFPFGIYIVCNDGSIVDASGWEPESDPREKSYFILGKECTNGMKFVEAYLDELTNEFVVTATRYEPGINGQGGVICTDISLAILSEVVGNVKVEGDGDAFILDTEYGMVLAHNDENIRGKEGASIEDSFYSKVNELALAGSEKFKTIKGNAGEYMVSYEPIEGTSWVVVVRAPEKKIFADVYKLGSLLIGLGVVVIVLLALVLIKLINKVTTPINNISDAVVAITDGDFTTDIPVSGNDEVTVMANNLNKFISVMRNTLNAISDTSETINTQSVSSNEIATELYDSAGGQAEAMGNMMANLEELVKSIEAIAEDATALAMVVADTDEAGGRAIVNIQDTMQEADEGRNSMVKVSDSMAKASDVMDKLGHSIEDVGEAAVKIDNITATIKEIAEQTNLLALNASIEAARAGEAGKGFAVVATEIKGLADTSADAANEIAELITSVTALIGETVNQSKESVEQISGSTELVSDASKQFNSIYDSIKTTNDIVHTMIEKIHKTNDVASNMAAITEEQSASAEEIETSSINVKELANIVTNNSAKVKDDAADLAKAAEGLNEILSQFKI